MSDSEQQPFFPVQEREEKRNILPMAIGAVVVAVIIAVLVFATRAGKSSGSDQRDPSLAKLQIADLHMATAQNFAGNSVTYIEGRISNGTDRKVTGARVEVVFKNSIGEITQDEKSLPVTVVLPNVPYLDYGTIDRAPLAPGQSRDFRLTLEHVSADWDGQVPQVKLVSIAY